MVESKAKNLKKMLSWSESSSDEDEDELKAIEKEVISHRRQGNICRGVTFKAKPFKFLPEIYIQSAPNNLNETYTFMCLGRAGRFGQH